MKKYTIVSTFPAHGSQNIGDALITKATKDLIRSVKGEDVCFNIVWRAEKWENIEKGVLESDAVIFACLAIRENMESNTYPFINQIISSNIPYAILSAGTSLNINELEYPLKLRDDSIKFLKKLSDKALIFTTRGLLTQQFCLDNNLNNSIFTGDIAFHDSRFENRKFSKLSEVKRIVISDPHYSNLYLDGFIQLIRNISTLFPQATIAIHIHGKNPIIENYCKTHNVNYQLIYEDIEGGLDLYDDYDLHVGFRVHGHVSMLKRRKPSYLLEQDGRGHDYGLSLNVNSSYPCFNPIMSQASKINKVLTKFFPKNYSMEHVYSVNIITTMIKEDINSDFAKFLCLEDQIREFVNKLKEVVTKLP